MKGFDSKFYRTDNDGRSSISFSFKRKDASQIKNWTVKEKEAAMRFLHEAERKFIAFKNDTLDIITN